MAPRRSSPTYKRALLSLSRGGADASVVREFDLATKAFVEDGFRLPEAKSQVAWRDRTACSWERISARVR